MDRLRVAAEAGGAMNEQVPTKDQVWCLTDARINEFQVATIDRLIARAGAAHYVNIEIRINGETEIYEADWLRHLKRVTDPVDQMQLMSFYDVKTKDELIDRLHHHIERLQRQLPPSGGPAFQRAREG